MRQDCRHSKRASGEAAVPGFAAGGIKGVFKPTVLLHFRIDADDHWDFNRKPVSSGAADPDRSTA